jgi:hypothetical protein
MGTTFDKGYKSYVLTLSHEAQGEGQLMRFPDVTVAIDFLRGLLNSPSGPARLRELLSGMELSVRFTGEPDHGVLERLAWDLVMGNVRATEITPDLQEGVPPAEEPPRPPESPPPPRVARRVERMDWIEIQVVDPDGEPVRNVRYKITWPDGGTESEGRTDRNGIARVDPIQPGVCEISLVDYHETDWEPVD